MPLTSVMVSLINISVRDLYIRLVIGTILSIGKNNER